jgi:28S ribosomal protein S9, putative (fragment)
MLPPEEIYPRQKAAEFNTDGRPYHFLFYTGRPNLCESLYKISENYSKCNQIEDKMIEKGIRVPPVEAKAILTGSKWMTRQELEYKLLEKISDQYWATLIYGLEKLAAHPYSNICQDFLMNFRRELKTESSRIEISPLTYTEDGRPYSKAQGKLYLMMLELFFFLENGNHKLIILINYL